MKDPEVITHGENSFTVFCIAVQDGYGDKRKTCFFDCIASGKTGENIAKYFEKGKPILVEGKLYTKKNDDSGFKEIRISVYTFFFINGSDNSKPKSKKPTKKKEESHDYEDVPF